ncbi:HAD-IIA family hydrolase [Actinoplanes sp. NPDC049118]|uniref:HAD-IIA family hydrolase n=1 Tax=Actinoplanes sp. NPDC049118 TaxID=3155769 RepID=UPI0033F7D40E
MESQTVLLDLDGTLHEHGDPVPGAARAIEELRRAGHVVRLFTNTDSQPEAVLVHRIRQLGIPIATGELFTPVTAAQRVLASAPECRVLVLADEPVRNELARHGRLLSVDEAEPASHVVIGDCRRTLSYRYLDAAFRAVRAGAELLALQRGRYYRAADGDHLDTGAIVAAVEYAADRPARVLGKPSQDFLRLAAESAGGTAAGRLWVVGDDRTTDIVMANAGAAISVQVRTGKYADQLENGALAHAAHVIDSVAELPELLARCLS